MLELKQFFLQHLIASLSGGTVIAAATVWLGSKLPIFARAETAAFNAKLFAAIKNPTFKAIAIGFDKVLDDNLPDAGDSKYALVADMISSEIPAPEGPLLRPLILSLLSGLGAGAKAGLADALQAQTAAAPGLPAAAKAVVLAILAAGSLLLASPALAGEGASGYGATQATPADPVVIIARSTSTIAPISISTMGANAGPTLVIRSTSTAYAQIEIQNLEASANVFCNERVNVSTSTTAGIKGAGVRGEKVAAAASKQWTLFPGQPWYCVCDGTSACDTEVWLLK